MPGAGHGFRGIVQQEAIEIIEDKILCSALVDRLCHKAFMVNMTGPSYRVKETQNIFKKL